LVPNVTPNTFNSFNSWQKASGETPNGNSAVLTDFVNNEVLNTPTACPALAGDANFVRIPADSESFYTCVAQPDGVTNTQTTNKSVIVYLQGNAAKDPNQTVGVNDASSLPKLESQVLIRGQIQN
jgi:hypothetical protein